VIATTTSLSVLAVSVALATLVEMVEALTIVVAVGHTRGWRSALEGTVAALASLGALVAVFGPALSHLSLNPLRLFVGGVLLVFGLQWLRKAILRAAGLKAMHDEDEIYARTVADLRGTVRDRIAFVTAFKGVFLEGIEVVVMVLTMGASEHQLGLASVVAVSCTALVAAVGAVVSQQLSRVPENTMKFVVGAMLCAYGTFWSAEGLGHQWPGGDAMLLVLAAGYLLLGGLCITALKTHEVVA
jgi:uncharacterized membrane protein